MLTTEILKQKYIELTHQNLVIDMQSIEEKVRQYREELIKDANEKLIAGKANLEAQIKMLEELIKLSEEAEASTEGKEELPEA